MDASISLVTNPSWKINRYAVALIALTTLCPIISEAIPLSYTALEVNSADDKYTAYTSPIINNTGEILYIKTTVESNWANAQIISSRRGLLLDSPGNSQGSSNLRFPDFNNLGEYVYADASGPGGFRVHSNLRGELGFGNLPQINDHGYVAAQDSGPLGRNYPLGIFAPTGAFTPVALNENIHPDYLSDIVPVRLTNAGELLYVAWDASRARQLFSSTRGQLTHFLTDEDGLTAAANNRGEFVYRRNNALYGQDGDLLWQGAEGTGSIGYFPDMNDLGDIVFNSSVLFPEPSPYEPGEIINYGTFETVLLTTRPEEYIARDGFKVVPEPNSSALFIAGLMALGFMYRRRSL